MSHNSFTTPEAFSIRNLLNWSFDLQARETLSLICKTRYCRPEVLTDSCLSSRLKVELSAVFIYPTLKAFTLEDSCKSCLQVLNWMEDAGIQPSLEMYSNVLSYACKDNSTNYAAFIREKIGT